MSAFSTAALKPLQMGTDLLLPLCRDAKSCSHSDAAAGSSVAKGFFSLRVC